MKAWVLTWETTGGGDCTVARVYLDQQRAEEDLDLVAKDSVKTWKLTETKVTGRLKVGDGG